MRVCQRRRFTIDGRNLANLKVLFGALVVGMPLVAHAQRVQIPSTAQPGTPERQLQQLPEPAKPVAGATSSLELPETAAPAGAQDIRFTLKQVVISGNTQIPTPELQSYAKPLLDHEISLAQFYDATRKMTADYRNSGFILANVVIPAQQIANGIVRIEVVEGFISKVNFEGSHVRQDLVNSGRDRLLATRPLRAKDLERFLLLLNDLPGVTAQGVLAPSQTVPGAAELTVKLAQQHVSVSAGASYRGSELQGPGQWQADVSVDSLFGLNESTSFQYLQAFAADELQLYALTHTERLTASGLDLTLSASHSEGNPDLRGTESLLNLATNDTQGSAQLSYPLIRTRFLNLKARAELTYNDAKTNVVGFPLSEDKIAAARFGLYADVVDPWLGVNVVDVEYGQGIGIFGASKFGDPLASRPDGNPKFSKVTLYVARLQSFPHGFSLLLAADGQWAFSHLLNPEEFAFGGDQFGRAYDPSDLVGDNGIAAKAELRYTQEFAFGLGYTVYGFGETAYLSQRPVAGETGPDHDSATDVGGGIRFSYRSWLTGYIEVAKPTNHVITATGDKETRVFGGLIYAFHY
jgi:hemolysin activation/secretion protein